MRKPVILAIALIFFLSSAYSLEYNPLEEATNQQTQQQIQNDQLLQNTMILQQLNEKINNTVTFSDFNGYIVQLDHEVKTTIKNNINSQTAFIIGILIFNDILILAFLGVLKSGGYL